MTKKTIVVEADLLSELASDLEDYLRLTYDTTYPSEARRFERDMEPVNRARELLKEQPPEVQVEPDPCLDRFALDLMQRIWAIGDMDTPVSQRKAQIQVELIESLEPFYSGRNKQTIDTGKVREILAEMANKVSFFWGYGSNANKCYELADEYADQIASLVGCDKTIHDAIQYLINKTFGGSFPDGGFEIYMAGIGAAIEAIEHYAGLTRPPEPESNDEN